MYKDIIYKINIHKQRIIDSFIKRGIYPNNDLINSQLNDIEMRTSIFKYDEVKIGERFDTEAFNRSLNDIYCDLMILYKLLNSVVISEYNSLNRYVIAHIRELECSANAYLSRANIESMSASIGKSLLFKHKEFDITNNGNNSKIELGNINIENGTKLACIASINNVDYSDVIFRFKSNDGEFASNAYNYNHDIATAPGNLNIDTYNVEINKMQKINGILELPVVIPSNNSGSVITLAGKKNILYKSINSDGEIIEYGIKNISDLSFTDHSYIDFYIIGGKSVNFRFNKKPLSTNFNYEFGYVENLKYIHHFFIECDKDFAFSIELEKGDVYAIKENSIVEQDKIYYSGQVDVKDFLLVHEYSSGNKEYSVGIDIMNKTIEEDDIVSVMIKEIE